VNRARWLNVSLLSAWLLFAIFALSGVPTVPFHPDESTYLYMSHDFDVLLRQGNPTAVTWQAANQPADVLSYRLLDSPLSDYLPGLGRLLSGYPETLSHDWNWSGDWQANLALGAVPAPGLLTAARWPAAALAVLSVLPLYGIGRRLGGPLTGTGAALLYAFSGLLLLHGRRAMAEGPVLFFVLLTIWLMVAVPRLPLLWSASAALALVAKLTALALLPVVALALLRPGAGEKGWRGWTGGRRWLDIGLSASGFLGMSWLLTPPLWSQPIAGLAALIHARQQLTTNVSGALLASASSQVATTLGGRLFAMLYQVYFAPPAFWEFPNYAAQTAAAEQRYLAVPLQAGWHTPSLNFNLIAGGLLLALSLAGLLFALRHLAQPVGGETFPLVLMLVWTLATVAGLLTINITWQRYYLPLLPIVCLWAAFGGAQVARPFTAALAARQARVA
jgi:hypothetical protein